jgi:hypothetical protein
MPNQRGQSEQVALAELALHSLADLPRVAQDRRQFFLRRIEQREKLIYPLAEYEVGPGAGDAARTRHLLAAGLPHHKALHEARTPWPAGPLFALDRSRRESEATHHAVAEFSSGEKLSAARTRRWRL